MISKLLFWQLHSDIRNILVLLTKLHHTNFRERKEN